MKSISPSKIQDYLNWHLNPNWFSLITTLEHLAKSWPDLNDAMSRMDYFVLFSSKENCFLEKEK